MRCARLLPVLAVLCLSAFAAPARAETAGQVLAVVGEALALRTGHIMRLFPGASVESGDQIHTGPDSGVQIRFTDWGFVSLRARTDFVVDDYVYEARRGGRARAFFSLLNGGIRSLTGEIGHQDRSAFRLRTTTATVGVRGTHFSVLICKQDCRNPDGSLGEDGLYGEVLDGRIAVSPYGGASLEREFRAGESFRLVNENSIPGPLFSPPPFLPDKLDPQARSGGKGAAPIASVGGVVPGSGSPAPNPDPLPGVTGGNLGSTASDLIITPLANQIVLPAAQLPGSMVNAALSMPALGPAVPLVGFTLNAVPTVVAPLMQGIGALVVPVVGGVTPVVGGVVTPVVGGVVTPVVGGVVTPVVGGVVTPVVGGVVTPVVGGVVTPVVGGVVTPVVGGVVTPVVGGVVTPVVGGVVAPVVGGVAPVVAPVVGGVAPVVAPVAPVIAPVAPVIAPVVSPVVAPVVPVITPVIAPVAPVIAPVVSPVVAPVAPVITPVIAPVAPVIAPALPPVASLPPVTAPSLPAVSLPTLPSLPLSTKATAPLLRR